MIIIGIIGNKEKFNLTKILFNYLIERGKRVLVLEQVYNTNFSENSKELDYIIIEMSIGDIHKESYKGLEFNIIIESLLESGEDNVEELQKLVLSIKEKGYFIFNSDYINKISFKCNNLYPITYGLNGKTSVTASSVKDLDALEFSLCLQRVILTIEGEVIQPFERPIRVDAENSHLHYWIAALTSILVLGYKF